MKNSENPSRLLHSLFITMLLAVSCASCIYIPHIHSSDEKGITDDSLSRIQPGKTTKEEVLLAFGCPTSDSQIDEFSTFTYEWWITTGYWVPVPPPGAWGPIPDYFHARRDYSLTVEFDSSNRVIKYGLKKKDKRGEPKWFF